MVMVGLLAWEPTDSKLPAAGIWSFLGLGFKVCNCAWLGYWGLEAGSRTIGS